MELDRKHYEFIADSLYRITVQFDRMMPFNRTRTMFGDHLADVREQKILTWVRDLQVWNLCAWNERYPNDADPDYGPDFVKHIRPLGGDLNGAQFLKALECARYQCIDAVKFSDSPNGKELDLVIREAKDFLIDQLPEYKAAQWSMS